MIDIKYKDKTYCSDDDGCVSFYENKISYTRYDNWHNNIVLVNIDNYDLIKLITEDFSFSLPKSRIRLIMVDGDSLDLEWDEEKFVDGSGNGKNIIETDYINGVLEIV